MDIKILKTACFDLSQSDKTILNDAMIILDNCARDCRNQAELTEDLSLKETLEDCAADFDTTASHVENILFMVKDGVQV